MDNGGNLGIAQMSSMKKKKKRGETYSQGAFPVSVHRCTNTLCQSILMHYPVGLHTFGCPAFVKHQRFLHPNLANSPHRSVDGFVGPRSLPVAGGSRSVGSGAVRILPVPGAEEIPFPFSEDSLS